MQKQWWKESVIYQIYPRSFNDSNGDGIGDLRGIIEKLDYLKELGVDIIWLSPIYESPNDDNGYDISDYYNIMKDFGTMADFDEMLAGIHARGMRLLMDLVVNHTSDEHHWYQEAQKSPDSPYRDYYFFRPEPPNNWQSLFGGPAWDYDEVAGAYYLHLFTKKQPDLNWENPKVRQEVYQLMRFWLDKGVDGFRMDVIPMISKFLDFPDGDFSDFNKVIETLYTNGPRVHEYLQEMHEEVLQHYDIMTVGEGVGISPEQANLYVGEQRKELNMIFHFGHMFIDHGPGGKFDIVDFPLTTFKGVFDRWDEAIGTEGWLNIYLDNHDFPRMVSRFGNDKAYHEESAKLLAMLTLTLRGTPCIYQGSEIGMTNVAFPSLEDYRDVETINAYKDYQESGKDLEELLKIVHVQGRDNVRTPFQWDASANGGFTNGTPWIKSNPNYTRINAHAEMARPKGIWHFYQQLLAWRKARPTFAYGNYQPLVKDSETLFAYIREDASEAYYVVLNFTDTLQKDIAMPAGDWELVLNNYEDTTEQLRPWEGKIYQRSK